MRRLLFDPSSDTFNDNWQRADWMLLQNSAIHSVDDDSELSRARDELTRPCYNVVWLDATRWSDLASAYEQVSDQLKFPRQGARGLDGMQD